jgi:protein-tyrosine phosphatase
VTRHGRSRHRILITDVHELAGLSAARSLGRAGYAVVGSAPITGLVGAGAASRHFSELVAAPSADTSFREFHDWLRQYCNTHDVSAVLPIAPSSELAASQLAHRGEVGCRVIASTGPLTELTESHYLATQAAEKLGLTVPPTWYLCDGKRRDAAQLRAVRLPCLLRSDSTLSPRGEYVPRGTWEASTPDDCSAVADECLSVGARLMAQQLAPGRDVAALFVRWGGEIILNSTVDQRILAGAEAFLSGFAHEGLALVQYRVHDAAPAQLIGVTSSLAEPLALRADIDLPTALVDLALDGRTDVRAVGPRRRGRAARADYFWWTDPLPGLRRMSRFVGAVGQRAADGVSRLLSVTPHRMLTLTAPPERIGRPRSILVLCRGNLCRSPFVAALLARRLAESPGAPIEVRSAGLETPGGEQLPERFARLLGRYGVRLDSHCSRGVSAADIASADLVLVMDMRNLASMYRRFRPALAKTLMLGTLDADATDVEIADPVRAAAPEAAKVYERLAACVAALAVRLRG